MRFTKRWFKPIPGFPGYWINKRGFIFSEKSKCFLAWAPNIKFYPRVVLYLDGSRTRFFVHRLVAIVFNENPDPVNKTQVNHNDFDVTNPHSKNLSWMTQSENMRYNRLKPWTATKKYSNDTADCPF